MLHLSIEASHTDTSMASIMSAMITRILKKAVLNNKESYEWNKFIWYATWNKFLSVNACKKQDD